MSLGVGAAQSVSSLLGANTPQSAVAPVVILILCAVAGAGTVLLLPGKRETAFRKMGGALLLAAALILAALLIRFANNATGDRGGMSAYFWLFSAVAVFAAIRVITHPRPVYSALYFILSVLASAGLFILLHAEFMAAALVIIYAGAILVTYVFVIMLASPGSAQTTPEYDQISREPLLASAIGFTMMGVLLFVIFDRSPAAPLTTASAVSATTQPVVSPVERPYPDSNTQALAVYLFKNQLVNLELAGLILTLGMIGAILIARRRVVVKDLRPVEVLHLGPTPVDDNPHSIPVYGTQNPRAKAYPET